MSADFETLFAKWQERALRERGHPRYERRTHCKRGHEYRVVGRDGIGRCGECRRVWNQKQYAAQKAQAVPKEKKPRKPRRLKTHCKYGHARTPETVDAANGICRVCQRNHCRNYRMRKAAK